MNTPAAEPKSINWTPIIVIAVVLLLAWLGAQDKASSEKNSSCATAWSNSYESTHGGSRSAYIRACEDGVRDVVNATH